MWSKSATLALALAIAATCMPATAQAPKRIQLAQLEAMFASMRASTPWNVDGPLLWGYFFYYSSRAKHEQAAKELQVTGYSVV